MRSIAGIYKEIDVEIDFLYVYFYKISDFCKTFAGFAWTYFVGCFALASLRTDFTSG